MTRQGRGQVCIEVPVFFDVHFLQDLVRVTVRFSLYEEDDQSSPARPACLKERGSSILLTIPPVGLSCTLRGPPDQ